MNYKKMTKIGSLCAALVVLGGTAVFVSAKETGKEEVAAAASPSVSVAVTEENIGEEDKDCVWVYFEEGISEERIEEIGGELQAVPGVEGAGYTSAEDAWLIFSREYLDEETVLSFQGTNPLKNSGNYTVCLSENGEEAVRAIEKIAGVRRVTKR